MTEPALAVLVAQATAKAVGGLAARSSAPIIKRIVKKAWPSPKVVKQFEMWAETNLLADQEEAIQKFVKSRQYSGLIQLLAFLEFDTSRTWEKERQDLKEAFSQELTKNLTLPDSTLDSICAELWSCILDDIRLTVRSMREESGFSASDLSYVKFLISAPIESGRSHITTVVNERAVLSDRADRVSQVHGLAAAIKEAARHSYRSMEMPHARRAHQIPIEKLYVHRTLSLQQVRPEFGTISAALNTANLPDFSLDDRRFVVIGAPGAGKSTFIRYLMYWLGSHELQQKPDTPILVELKRYSKDWSEFAIPVAASIGSLLQRGIDVNVIRDLFSLGYATVVFDGLDEIADIELRRKAASAIENFSRQYPLVKCVVTSRREGYLSAPVDPGTFLVYELPEFTNAQVIQYATSWFSHAGGAEPGLRARGANAFIQHSEHIKDLRSNPLMLSLLCLLYEYEGWIPENRLRVYEECASLMFERWDRIRNVDTPIRSDQEVWHLFQKLGYWMMFERESHQPVSESEIQDVLRKYFARRLGDSDTPRVAQEVSDFVEFCAGRAWLLTKVGTNIRGERLFDFSHRTFMEYFAACHISRTSQTAKELVDRLWSVIEDGKSVVVAQLAIQQYDLRVEGGLDSCIENFLDRNLPSGPLISFIADTLRYIQPSHKVLERATKNMTSYLARNVDPPLAVACTNMSQLSLQTLENVSLTIIRSSIPAQEDELLGGAIGYILAKTGQNRPSAMSIEYNPQRSDSSGPNWLINLTGQQHFRSLAQLHPQCLVTLLNCNLIGLGWFVRILGKRAGIGVISRPGRRFVPGPAYSALAKMTVETLGRDGFFQSFLEGIGESSNGFLPLDYATVNSMVEVLSRVQPDDVTRLLETLDNDRAAAGFWALVLSVACGAHELNLEWPSVLSALPELRGAPPVRTGASDRISLGQYCSFAVNTVGLSPTDWRDVFLTWQRGMRKISAAH